MENNDMSIYDVIEKKKELCENIATMIKAFEFDTKVQVESIDLDYYECMGAPRQYIVDIGVKI